MDGFGFTLIQTSNLVKTFMNQNSISLRNPSKEVFYDLAFLS